MQVIKEGVLFFFFHGHGDIFTEMEFPEGIKPNLIRFHNFVQGHLSVNRCRIMTVTLYNDSDPVQEVPQKR